MLARANSTDWRDENRVCETGVFHKVGRWQYITMHVKFWVRYHIIFGFMNEVVMLIVIGGLNIQLKGTFTLSHITYILHEYCAVSGEIGAFIYHHYCVLHT